MPHREHLFHILDWRSNFSWRWTQGKRAAPGRSISLCQVYPPSNYRRISDRKGPTVSVIWISSPKVLIESWRIDTGIAWSQHSGVLCSTWRWLLGPPIFHFNFGPRTRESEALVMNPSLWNGCQPMISIRTVFLIWHVIAPLLARCIWFRDRVIVREVWSWACTGLRTNK